MKEYILIKKQLKDVAVFPSILFAKIANQAILIKFDERPRDGKSIFCWRKGKDKLPKLMDIYVKELDYPEFFWQLIFDTNNPDYNHFRENIRSYISAMPFALMGWLVEELKPIVRMVNLNLRGVPSVGVFLRDPND